MITAVHFHNFKALREATLPLGRFTLLIGANGSGKSTAMQSLDLLQRAARGNITLSQQEAKDLPTIDVRSKPIPTEGFRVNITFQTVSGQELDFEVAHLGQSGGSVLETKLRTPDGSRPTNFDVLWAEVRGYVGTFRKFQFDPALLSMPSALVPGAQLAPAGENLAVVLDGLRDSHPERFEQLNQDLAHWLPEFDRILFQTPANGQRSYQLRTRVGGHPIPASQLSQGTLLALAFLTVSYLPEPPAIICFEEPERGIHPRLLRKVQDAMYRLAYPEQQGEQRAPVQVIATTHSPYLLDLYRDHPKEVVIAEKTEQGATFKRLVDTLHIDDIFQGEALGELWYSGIFGGVPVAT